MEYDCFLCHAKEDKEFTEELYLALKRAGFSPWMDKPPAPYDQHGIAFGRNWDDAIREAIKGSSLFLAILSSTSVSKRGYVQREYKLALDVMAEMPPEDIFLIPVLIDKCKIPQIKIDGVQFNAYQAMELHNRDISKIIRYFQDNRTPVNSSSNAYLQVGDFKGLINSILPNTRLELTREIEVLCAPGYQGRHFKITEQHDGSQLEICDLDNFCLGNEGGSRIHLYTKPSYANVLTFRRCTNIRLLNLKIGHYPDQGTCTGGVLEFSECKDVVISDCDLYGCGVTGLKFINCRNIYINDVNIRDCTYGIMHIADSKDIVFRGLSASNNREYYGFLINNSEGITFDSCDIIGNNFSDFLFEVFGAIVTVKNTKIIDNKFSKFSKFDQSVNLINCIVTNDVEVN